MKKKIQYKILKLYEIYIYLKENFQTDIFLNESLYS